MAKNKQTQNKNSANDCWDTADTQAKNSNFQSKNKTSNKAGTDKYGSENTNSETDCNY